ncbi:O-acetyltransferase OatA [Rubripirellula tenax]|uniref:O-acetyltransferase OatA n=1 Tax=Rubripirellula tenax TaxID=2528015 RepID=A0A5C6EPC6_9BACT|nr:acyltransferase [Rubripirellula tenax]TWU50942.1 O-acetyltransferase OatA [Rubripirellula tenax]
MTSPPPLLKQQRYPAGGGRDLGLDVVRFVAIVLVMGRHAAISSESAAWLQTWSRGGWVGVDLFFVLSGFLVSGLLFAEYQKHQRVRPIRFLIRRGFKIYPAFWAFMALTLTMRWWAGEPAALTSVVVELAFVQNYFAGIWIHTWSLAVEEHFYFMLALLMGALSASGRLNKRGAIPIVFAVLAIGCLALRLQHASTHLTFSASESIFRSHLRMDSLFYGVLISYSVWFGGLKSGIDRIPKWLMTAIGCALLSPAFVWPVDQHPWIGTYGLTLFYLGSGCIVIAALGMKLPSSAIPRSALAFAARAGAASYSIYLWHVPVNLIAIHLFVETQSLPIAYWSTYLIGSVGVGWVMHGLIERPAIALRNRCAA